MPIADSVAIYFTMPFFVAGLAYPVLGERVQIHRWLAIIAGFVGVIIMLDPSSDVFEPAAFFALYSAFGYALGPDDGPRHRPACSADRDGRSTRISSISRSPRCSSWSAIVSTSAASRIRA